MSDPDNLELFKREREWRRKYSATAREWIVDENDACRDCGGSGYKLYGSTATWRGGIGGAAMTTDVCDKCWGSGSASRPWPSHRKFFAMESRNSPEQTADQGLVDALNHFAELGKTDNG